MKLKKIYISNFKGIQSIEFRLDSVSQRARPLTVLLGDNGSGKTTILQAIALTLSLATRRTRNITSFNWHGFLPERISSLGPTFVELEVAFTPEEVSLTCELFEAWQQALSSEVRQIKKIVPPSQDSIVTLQFENGRVTSPSGMKAVNQFLGRYYVKALQDSRPELKERFALLGDVFWFDQHRNLGSLMWDDLSNDGARREGWQAGVEQLREYLVGWWGHHTTKNRRGRDLIEPLERQFNRIFPGTHFSGISPRENVSVPKANDFYFLMERDDGRIYDLAEMSSGEQAIFPLIYEFVRLDIQRSIVLIDELELHLHPPEQQRLLAALPKIGSDCQFIITTHSEFLSSAIPNEHTVRLDRGTRCL